MAKSNRGRWPPPAPPDPDPQTPLPSDGVLVSVTVKLDASQQRMLCRCRVLLGGPEGATYPSISRTLRLALSTLYHSLTGHPPTEDKSNGTTT